MRKIQKNRTDVLVNPTSPAMLPNTSILLPFLLLIFAIYAVWAAPLAISLTTTLRPWTVLFVLSINFALAAGVLHAVGALTLICLWLAAQLTESVLNTPRQGRLRLAGCIAVTTVLAFALAIHQVPGFSNPVVISGARLSADAASFTQYANYDKGAVGLLLLAFLCKRSATWAELGSVLKKTLPVLLLTLAAVLGLALASGMVHPDFKIPRVTMLFLVVNLFFTVIAEEAFFRGFLQERLAAALGGMPHAKWIALLCCALLFGAAHLAGGPRLALMAGLAGLGYGYAYAATNRIEAPIAVHFALNAVHFIGFTYPYATV